MGRRKIHIMVDAALPAVQPIQAALDAAAALG